MTTKNRTNSSGGRPLGSRNKTKASAEIKKALSKGKGLLEFKKFLEDKMADEKISDVQMNKYLDKYWDLLKFVHVEFLKLESLEEDKSPKKDKEEVEVYKGKNTENSPAKVHKISFTGK